VCPFKADHDFILCTLGNKGELSQNLPRNATEPFSDTWTGRGRKPKWVEALLESGKTLEDIEIK
jgi:DNA-binding protein H-NS